MGTDVGDRCHAGPRSHEGHAPRARDHPAHRWGVPLSADLHASLLLHLLLADSQPRVAADESVWQALLPVARRNGVLLRCLERIPSDVPLPEAVEPAAAAERSCVRATLKVVRRVGEACAAHGIGHVFISALQHYPDVGADVDLLIGRRTADVDAVIAAAVSAAPLERSLGAKLAGTVAFACRDGAVPLDIHYGRLGLAGEHTRIAERLLANPRSVVVAGTTVLMPSPDDYIVLQGIHRLYGRRHIRLGDVVTTIEVLRREPLDWDYIVAQARETGTLAGLSCYLRYLELVHHAAVGGALLDPQISERLDVCGWGPVSLRGGVLRYPVFRVNARLFRRSILRQLQSGNWSALGRLSLVPFVACESSLRRLARRRGGSIAPAWGGH